MGQKMQPTFVGAATKVSIVMKISPVKQLS